MPVAVFDFDHTLTKRDSLLPFLFFAFGRLKTIWQLLMLTPAFSAFLLGLTSRKKVKERILSRFIKGMHRNKIAALGELYASQALDCHLRKEAMERLLWHQSRGHRCLVASASFDFYLVPWAKRKGIEAVLASRLEFDATERATGRVLGANCWGAEKCNRLLDYFKGHIPKELYVYGDSRGDQELLAMADHPFYRTFSKAL